MKEIHSNAYEISKEYSQCPLTEEQCTQLNSVLPFRVSEHYLNLMNWSADSCPIRTQAIPSLDELHSTSINLDACNEQEISVTENLLQRYDDRVLLLVSNQCFTYCRFCTRKWFVGRDTSRIEIDAIMHSIDRIAEDQGIKEVILSGGDPLFLQDKQLELILDRLSRINHVRIIRIGSRAPVTYPQRITPALCSLLKKYRIIWFMVHFNHASEIVEESITACNALRMAGIPILNQSVLLNNVNDTPEVLEALFTQLVEIGVKPYYLYLCDRIPGTEHFCIQNDRIKLILKAISQQMSGLALPLFVCVDRHSWKQRFLLGEGVEFDRLFDQIMSSLENPEFSLIKERDEARIES